MQLVQLALFSTSSHGAQHKADMFMHFDACKIALHLHLLTVAQKLPALCAEPARLHNDKSTASEMQLSVRLGVRAFCDNSINLWNVGRITLQS